MRERMPSGLYEPQENGEVVCHVCWRECRVEADQTGECGGYENEGGEWRDLTYGRVTAAVVTRLGWAPVKGYPKADSETQVLSVGGAGCNFGCSHCFNKVTAQAVHSPEVLPPEVNISPELLVEYARRRGCEGVAANFNEALLAARYFADIFRSAKEAGLFTVAVTNGYLTEKALDHLAPYLDVFRTDIKAVSAEAMERQARGVDPAKVLKSLVYLKENHPKVYLETVTLLVPGVNDSPEELGKIAAWIKNNLGAKTPWNLSHYQSPKPMLEGLRYLRPADLNWPGDAIYRLVEDRRGGGYWVLQVGVWPEDGRRIGKEQRQVLKQAAAIGRQAGLERVFIKEDLH